MNSFLPLVLGLAATEPDEVHVTTFAAVLVILTLLLLLVVSFYTLQLVIDCRRRIAPALVAEPAVAPQRVDALSSVSGSVSAPASADKPSVPPQVFAAIAAAIHVACGQHHRIISCEPNPVEFQELQAWSHAGRLHLHDHHIA